MAGQIVLIYDCVYSRAGKSVNFSARCGIDCWGRGAHNFQHQGRGGKKGILFLAWGFSRLVIASLLCDSPTPIDVVHSIKTPSSCNLYLGKH